MQELITFAEFVRASGLSAKMVRKLVAAGVVTRVRLLPHSRKGFYKRSELAALPGGQLPANHSSLITGH
jgi:hypothetical protein